MRSIFGIIILFFVLTSCFNRSLKVCSCCENVFTNIDSATNCISRTPPQGTTSDDRLFLLVFSENPDSVAGIGWNTLRDNDIIEKAKRNYLLISLDGNTNFPNNSELMERMQRHHENIYFVIVNQALYPFHDWSYTEPKNNIIDNLIIGNGP